MEVNAAKTAKKSFFLQGEIPADRIAKMIDNHRTKHNVGAHRIFLGQVRADEVPEGHVQAIEFSAYLPVAEETIRDIRETAIVRFGLTCAHVLHSLGRIDVGGLCFLVMVSSPHRKEADMAVNHIVEAVKSQVPIYGREVFADLSHRWKANT